MGFLKSKKKVSLVLGGGGARGIVQIGVINTLIRKGYVIDEIIGCSIGSLVGAAFAEGKLRELEEWMQSITRMQVFRMMDFANPRFGLLKGARVFDTLKDIFADIAIEELPLRYVAVATDLNNEKEVVFDKGSIYEAIRASIAIPALFTGINKDDQYLVDGGVLNPLPLNLVKKKRRNIVIAVNLDGMPVKDPDAASMTKLSSIGVLQEAYFAMRRKLSSLSIEIYKPEYVIHIPHNIAGIWDYHKSAYLIEKGIEYTDALLPNVK